MANDISHRVAATLFLTGCGFLTMTQAVAAENYQLLARVCDSIQKKLPRSQQDLSSLFGAIVSRHEETIPSAHDHSKIEAFLHLEFADASATLWSSAGPDQDPFVELDVRIGAQVPGLSTTPGATAVALRRDLGDPEERSDDVWDYACSDEVGPTLRFKFAGGLVNVITWFNYPD